MGYEAKQDPLFEAVRRLILQSGTPSVAYVQIEFSMGYRRANSLLEALEGDVVTTKDEQGMRKMLKGETKERHDSVIVAFDDNDSGR